MKTSHLLLKNLVAGLLCVFSTTAFALGADVNIDDNDVVVSGYDAVAYFTEGLANKGRAEYTVVHDGAIYRFGSKENRDLFRAEPEKYVPQYGGFCAYGITKNRKFDANPTAWYVVDGKLYLNLSRKILKRWEKDVAGNIDDGDEIWLEMKGIADADLEDDFPVFSMSNDEKMEEFW